MTVTHTIPPAAPAQRVPWRFLLGVTTLLGLASGLRIYFTYNALGVEVSLLDGFGSGLIDWLLWIPLAPLAFWLAGRFDTERGNAGSSLSLHVGAGVAASFAQLTLFAIVSSVVRAWRFGEAFHVNLSSPILMKLVPGIAVYWILVLGWWWRASRSELNELGDNADPVLEFKAGRGRVRVRAGEIDWVAAAGNYVELHTMGETHLVRETLKGIYARLGARRFQRIHRTTLVRREAIVSVHPAGPKPAIVVRDGTRLEVGRSFRRELDGHDTLTP